MTVADWFPFESLTIEATAVPQPPPGAAAYTVPVIPEGNPPWTLTSSVKVPAVSKVAVTCERSRLASSAGSRKLEAVAVNVAAVAVAGNAANTATTPTRTFTRSSIAHLAAIDRSVKL